MKRILVINPEKSMPEALKVHTNEVHIDVARVEDFILVVENGTQPKIYFNGEPLGTYDTVFFRLWRAKKNTSVPLAHALVTCGYTVLETELAESQYRNKVIQNLEYAKNNITIPKTVFIPRGKILEHISVLDSELSYPMIMKSATGKKGEDNHLVQNAEDVESALKNSGKNVEFIFQEYVPNNFDYRILVLGYKAAYAYKRQRPDDSSTHLNNISQGSTSEEVPLKDIHDIIPIAETCARLFQREVCGVDIIVSTESGKPYVLESNSAPGVKALQARKKLIEYLSTA